VAQVEGDRTRQRLFADYAPGVQHGFGRVHGLVQACAAARLTKATVSAWRVSLQARGLGSSSIIIRMSAIRKLAVEAADNGLLAPELAAGIVRVKSVKSTGIRVGNWLSLRQAQALLSAPDIATMKGLRDRAILAVLLGCGLRRSNVPNPAVAAREGSVTEVPSHGAVLSECFRGRCGETRRKAGCSSWARPV
jgi:site-specific recombinase XerC